MILRLSGRAERDLEWLYWQGAEQFGLSQAERYVAELSAVLLLIAENPQAARLRHDIEPPLRSRPFRAHVVYYREEGQEVVVIRILHARQDWLRHLL